MNATVAAPTRTCKPAPEVHGSVRLLKPIGPDFASAGEVEINGRRYLCGRFPGGFRLGTYNPKTGKASQYDLPDGFHACTCGDHTFRHRLCKHAKALAALASRELL